MKSPLQTSQTTYDFAPRGNEIHFHPTMLVTTKARPLLPVWAFYSIGIGLLIVAVLFDAYRLFDRQWSNLYFLIALYTAWCLRGRAEISLYVTVVISTFIVPIFIRPEMRLFNRITGAIVGLTIVAVIRDRRRLIMILRDANRDLESKVIARTWELQASQQRLEELSRKLISTQETERTHLAHELHDEIGQVLTAMKMNLRRLQAEPNVISSSILEENVEMVDNAIEQVRNLAVNLHPPHLDQLGLIAALHWLGQDRRLSRTDYRHSYRAASAFRLESGLFPNHAGSGDKRGSTCIAQAH